MLHPHRFFSRLGIALCATAALAAVSAGSAAADSSSDPAYPGSTLKVSVSGPLQAKKVLHITATGTNAPDSFGTPISYGLDLIVVDPSILPGPCNVSESAELTAITNVPDGGRLLTYDTLNEGDSGPFRITTPYEPGGSGPLRVCAYSVFVTDDAAHASTTVQIKPAGAKHSAAARPHNTTRPRITRSGRTLTCRRGSWSGKPTHFSYRWRIGGGRYGRASAHARYTIGAKARGKTVSCSVTARNAAGSATASSKPFRVR